MVPLVSFIVAARDASSTLPAALDSLAAQSVADFEIVVVDDASSQPLEELVDFKAYECLRLLRSSRPLGRSAARNAAIQEAKGKFVAIQDADDVSAPNRLALQLDLMDANSSVVACSGQLIQFCDDQYWRGPSWPTASGDLRREFERGRMRLAHPASMMRRAEVVKAGGYDLSLDRAEDFDLFRRLLGAGELLATREVLLGYRHPKVEELALYMEDRLSRRRAAGRPSGRLACVAEILTYPAYVAAMQVKRPRLNAINVPAWLPRTSSASEATS